MRKKFNYNDKLTCAIEIMSLMRHSRRWSSGIVVWNTSVKRLLITFIWRWRSLSFHGLFRRADLCDTLAHHHARIRYCERKMRRAFSKDYVETHAEGFFFTHSHILHKSMKQLCETSRESLNKMNIN